jgi:transcription elongation factor Elf1
MKTAKVISRHPKHFVTMINFNYECVECGYDNSVSLSEEEELLDNPTLTCSNCKTNNTVTLKDIYGSDW